MRFLKQSTAIEVKVGPFLDETDGKTAETALTIAQADVRLAKNAGDWAQKAETTTLVHEENGWYRCLLDTTDTNTLGILMLAIHESGALPVWVEFHVLIANVYDSLISSGDILGSWFKGGDANSFTASVLATDAVAEIADGVWDEDATGHQSAGTFGLAIGDPVASTETLYKAIVTDPAGTNIAADVIAIKAETAGILDDTDDIGVAGAGLTALGTAAELAKVPKSDGAASWNATALAAINTQADLAFSDYDPPTRAEATADRDTILAYLVPMALKSGAIGSTGNDTTHLHLDGYTYGDDEINNMLLLILDSSEGEYHTRWVEDWVLSTELATVATLPFTPQNATDLVWLLSARKDVTTGAGLDAAGVRAALGFAAANFDTQVGDLPTNAELTTALGTADDAVLTQVALVKAKTDLIDDLPTNAELATALGTADDATLAQVALVKAVTDQLLALIDALPTALENADALLNRDMAAVSDTNARSPLMALRAIRNKVSIVAGTLTVTKENDTTAAWTAAVTTAAGNPISEVDPA